MTPLEVRVTPYREIVMAGPLNLVLHVLVIAAVAAFLSTLRRKSDPALLYLYALIPILLGAVMMWRWLEGIWHIMGPDWNYDLIAVRSRLWGITQIFQVTGGTTAAMLLIAEIATFARKRRMTRASTVTAAIVLLIATTWPAMAEEEGHSLVDAYIQHAFQGGPIVMLLNLFLLISVILVPWRLWRSTSRLEPFVCALFPLAFGACLMWLPTLGMIAIMSMGGLTDPVTRLRLEPIILSFYTTAGLSSLLLLLAAVVTWLRRGKLSSGSART